MKTESGKVTRQLDAMDNSSFGGTAAEPLRMAPNVSWVEPYSPDWVGLCWLGLIDLLTVLGNTSLIVVVVRAPLLRRALTYMFVMNLCLVDLIASIAVVPLACASLYGGGWPFSRELCLVNGFLSSFCVIASILSLCAISIERFYIIKLPMDYAVNVTFYRALAVLLYIWLQSVVLAIFPVLGWNTYTFQPGKGHCSFSWKVTGFHKLYVLVMGFFGFIVPGMVMFFMYYGIYKVAHELTVRVQPFTPTRDTQNTSYSHQEAHTSDANCGKEDTDAPSPGDRGGHHSSHQITINEPDTNMGLQGNTPAPNTSMPISNSRTRRQSSQGPWKAVKTLVFIMSAYMALWGPYFLANFYAVFNGHLGGSGKFEMAVTWLGYASFAINPFIYGWMNRAVREELLVRFLSMWKWCKGSRQSEDLAMATNEDFFQFLERTSVVQPSVSGSLEGRMDTGSP